MTAVDNVSRKRVIPTGIGWFKIERNKIYIEKKGKDEV